MAVTAANLTVNGSSTDASSYNTASISPTAGKLVLATVYNQDNDGSPQTPTLSGNNLTWTQVATQTQGTNVRITMFRAFALAPTSGAITIDFAGDTQIDCMWVVDEITATQNGGTNGSVAIVQSASNSTNSAQSLSISLSAFSSPQNATYGATMMNGSPDVVVGDGFTELGNSNANPHSIQSQFKASNDTTVDWSWANNSLAAGIAIELRANTGGFFALM